MISSRALLLLLFALLVLWPLGASAQQAEEDLSGALRLSFQYIDGSAAPDLNALYYLNFGVRLEHPLFAFEIDTLAPIAFTDALIAGVSYLAGGEGELPIYDSLNDGDEPAWLPFFTMGARYNFYYKQRQVRIGAGPQIRYGLLSPYYKGERLPLTSFDAGLHLVGALELEPVRLRLLLNAGNGWTDESSLALYGGAGAEIDVRVWRWFGLFVRGSGRLQRFDRRGWVNDRYLQEVDEEAVRRVGWWRIWSADVGAAFLF